MAILVLQNLIYEKKNKKNTTEGSITFYNSINWLKSQDFSLKKNL